VGYLEEVTWHPSQFDWTVMVMSHARSFCDHSSIGDLGRAALGARLGVQQKSAAAAL
jgi:hypothetical protein